MQPVLLVLAYSAGATLLAAGGGLPLLRRDRVPVRWLGWSNAAAAGAMLGAAYLLAAAGIRGHAVPLGVGALIGIGFVWWAHAVSGTGDLELNVQGESPEGYGSDVLLVGALHAGAEGVAIGAAMAADPILGGWMAAAIGLHNIPEATLLASVFRSRGEPARRATLLAIVGNAPIVPMAVSTFAILDAAPAAAPWALGFASGALIYLVTVDLLPESYRQAGATSIATVTMVAMALVATVQRVLP
jgi:zinc transporter ZupT